MEILSCMSFSLSYVLKNYTIINGVTFLENYRLLLSFDKKARKFGELLENLLDELEEDISYTTDEFTDFIVLTQICPFWDNF